MTSNSILLRVYGEHRSNRWELTALELGVTVVALDIVKAKEYMRTHARTLLIDHDPSLPIDTDRVLRRSDRDMVKLRRKYWVSRALQRLDGRSNRSVYEELVTTAT